MPKFQPPNALIFLGTLFRPQLLRPDIRVPSIAHVDYKAFRRAGFSAVVIDKDNCLTIPERDELFPPLKTAWSELLAAFDPGRVLVVSNSAGTRKDPGGLAAESVTHHLRTPVLLHPTPKPACSALILQYFRGELPGPPQTSASMIRTRNMQLAQEEWDDKDAFVRMFTELAEGKILGETSRVKGSGIGGKDLIDPMSVPEKEMAGAAGETRKAQVNAGSDSAQIEAGKAGTSMTDTASSIPSEDHPIPSGTLAKDGPLRVLVIGDRLFTDTLLAGRLRQSLGQDNVVSIQTTLLPDPSDVRVLRWIEARLSRGRLRVGKEDWGRFVIRDNGEEESLIKAEQGLGWRRFIPFRRQWVGAPELGWRAGTWSFWGVVRGGWRGLARIGKDLGRGSRWVWIRGSRWVQERRARQAAIAASSVESTEAGLTTASRIAVQPVGPSADLGSSLKPKSA